MVHNASSLPQGFIPIQRGWLHTCLLSTGQLQESWAACKHTILTSEVGLKGEQGQVTLWDLRLTSEITHFLPQPSSSVRPTGHLRKSYPCWYFSYSGMFYTPLPADTFVGVVSCTLTKLPRMVHQ